jgi:hypothetical protein
MKQLYFDDLLEQNHSPSIYHYCPISLTWIRFGWLEMCLMWKGKQINRFQRRYHLIVTAAHTLLHIHVGHAFF